MSIGADELRPNPGATHAKKRVGRGNGSGHGTYSGRGLKGQKSRSGKNVRNTFEGGQMPLARRMHVLRGFNNKWRVAYQPVNLAALDRFDDGAEVTPEVLRTAGILKHLNDPVKVLGEGEFTKKLTVSAHRFSGAAREKIERAGGTIVLIGPQPEDVPAKKAKKPAGKREAITAGAPPIESPAAQVPAAEAPAAEAKGEKPRARKSAAPRKSPPGEQEQPE
jgi:large subunit ribosomal protein L15